MTFDTNQPFEPAAFFQTVGEGLTNGALQVLKLLWASAPAMPQEIAKLTGLEESFILDCIHKNCHPHPCQLIAICAALDYQMSQRTLVPAMVNTEILYHIYVQELAFHPEINRNLRALDPDFFTFAGDETTGWLCRGFFKIHQLEDALEARLQSQEALGASQEELGKSNVYLFADELCQSANLDLLESIVAQHPTAHFFITSQQLSLVKAGLFDANVEVAKTVERALLLMKDWSRMGVMEVLVGTEEAETVAEQVVAQDDVVILAPPSPMLARICKKLPPKMQKALKFMTQSKGGLRFFSAEEAVSKEERLLEAPQVTQPAHSTIDLVCPEVEHQ